MPKDVIYAADIQPFKSIVEALNGTGQFCFATPDIRVDGIPPPDPKRYLEITAQSSNGAMVIAPEIWVRALPNRPFTKSFVIAWTSSRGTKKSYYIMKLYNSATITDKGKHKLIILPSNEGGQPGPDDLALMTFDSQASMIMNILFIAKILKINLGSYRDLTDNKKFLAKFQTDVINAVSKLADTQLGPEDFKISAEYVATFTNPGIYRNIDKRTVLIKELGKPKSQIKSIWDSFYEIYSNLDLENKLTQWTQVIKANSGALPSFRWLDTLNKKTNSRSKNFDTRIEIQLKLLEGDKGYNPKIKDFYVTKFANNPKKAAEMLTATMVPTLWGSDVNDPNRTKGARQLGCIFLVPQLEYKFYSSGSPSVGWHADQLAIREDKSGDKADYDDAMAFFSDHGEDDQRGDNQFNDVTDENPV